MPDKMVELPINRYFKGAMGQPIQVHDFTSCENIMSVNYCINSCKLCLARRIQYYKVHETFVSRQLLY